MLHQNYPNPFNPVTVIRWQLAVGSRIELAIYNVLGEKIHDLVSDFYPAGSHQVQWDARHIASGIYYYTLSTGSGLVHTRKMVLIK
jgi:hypothetical protein